MSNHKGRKREYKIATGATGDPTASRAYKRAKRRDNKKAAARMREAQKGTGKQ